MVSEVKLLDCKEYMKRFGDKFFDIAVVDVPYGIGEDGSKNAGRTGGLWHARKDYVPFAGGDKEAPDVEYFIELQRVSRHQIIFGANHFIERIPNANSSCWLVWDKMNGDTDFADCELAWTSFKKAVRKFQWQWSGFQQQEKKPKYRELRIHPTQKPVELYNWIYRKFATPGMRILDTHLGSGSNRIAAWDSAMDFYASELSEHYFQAQEKRFNDYVNQGKVSDIFPGLKM